MSSRYSNRPDSHGRIRAYHFISANYGLDDLRHRRLKIARLDDLNDPFDLWAIAQPDRRLRKALRDTKEQMASRFGMLCFSLTWQNPLLWSHYADRHRGLALGFDIDSAQMKEINYVEERPTISPVIGVATVYDLLYTKYVDWKYEKEARVFTSLEEIDRTSGLYFANFGTQCVLKEVIVGALSEVTGTELRQVIGTTDADQVALTKGRLAFNSFRIVQNKLGFQED